MTVLTDDQIEQLDRWVSAVNHLPKVKVRFVEPGHGHSPSTTAGTDTTADNL